MKEKIKRLLQALEAKHQITILFAVENGSRAWGMDSQDSDYDVRFVYYRPLTNYISLSPQKEVITIAYDSNFEPCDVKGSLIDMCGFGIFKYLKLLAASNPTTIEWLNSPIVYLGNNQIELQAYMAQNFSQEKLFYHYFSLCAHHYKMYIQTGKQITYKKYLYTMRGLLEAKYVYLFDKIPPLKMQETVEALSGYIPSAVVAKLNEIIAIKSKGQERETILRIPLLDTYITQEQTKTYQTFHKRKTDKIVFDRFLQTLFLPELNQTNKP